MRKERVALLVGYVPHDSRPSPWEQGSQAVQDQIVSCLEGCCVNGDDAATEEEPSFEYLPAIGKHLGAYGCCNVVSINTDVLPAVDLQDEPVEENDEEKRQKALDNLAKERWCSDISLRLEAVSIRVFGRLVVPKDFDALLHVDRHIYEYLIPVEALLTSAELQGDGARHKHLQQRLRPALESFRGKRSFHNYACCTSEAIQGAGFSWLRKIHRVMCDGFFRTEDGEEFVVIAIEARNVLPEQVRRMAGICIAAVRGLVTVQQVQRSLDSGVTMNVPCAPECYEYLAQVVYEKYCWKNPASEHCPNEMHGWKFKKMRQQSKAWVREAMTNGDSLARFQAWLGHLDSEYTAKEEARENYGGEKLSCTFERLLGTGSGHSDPEADHDVDDAYVASTHAASKSLLVLRTSNRTQGVFALELAMKLQEAGLPEGCLHPDLGIGLVVLCPPADACCSAREWSSGLGCLLEQLPSLAGVRCHLELICWSETAEALPAKAGKLGLAFDTWTLTYEHMFPSVDLAVTPFLVHKTVPAVAIQLASVIQGRFVLEPEAAAAHLVVLEMKGGTILGRACPFPSEHMSGRATAGSDASRQPSVRRVDSWIATWTARRTFYFSASLDPYIATAAVSIALVEHRRHLQQLREARRRELREGSIDLETSAEDPGFILLDPCCGSGTVLGAAMHHGATEAWGCDIKTDFVEQAQNNFEPEVIKSGKLHFVCHDATAPFPSQVLNAKVEIIVGNPPWGVNIGSAEDGVHVAQSVMAQFPHATCAFIISEMAFSHFFQHLQSTVQIINHARIGQQVLMLARSVAA